MPDRIPIYSSVIKHPDGSETFAIHLGDVVLTALNRAHGYTLMHKLQLAIDWHAHEKVQLVPTENQHSIS